VLFNSYEFIAVFLPAMLLGSWLTGRLGGRPAVVVWLVGGSLVFYAWWRPADLLVLVPSVVLNYALAAAVARFRARGEARAAAITVAAGVALNLAVLGWFKYAGFFAETANALFEAGFVVHPIVLPLAISFFTFQQIAFLVDTGRGQAPACSPQSYALFVTFFPHLIAGPICQPRQMLPQFEQAPLSLRTESLALGTTVFVAGLFKKVVLADTLALFANPVFDAAIAGRPLSLLEAWAGALAYTLQLYFDFSGYSDMAIGLGRMLGISLPINFDSPYRATSMIDFWRRWHVSLSTFLRDYLYIPLGGNRRGRVRRYGNLLLTMLLGGLWHGAGWTFVFWGGLHGFALAVNHGWRALRGSDRPATGWRQRAGWLTTFVVVVVGWVLFRAPTFEAAGNLLGGMAGLNGITLPSALARPLASLAPLGVTFGGWREFGAEGGTNWGVAWLLLCLVLAVWGPNTQEWTRLDDTRSRRPPLLTWRPSPRWAIGTAVITAVSVYMMLSRRREFLYFQF